MKIAFTGDNHFHEYKEFSKVVTVDWSNEDKKFYESNLGFSMNSRLLDNLDTLIQIRDYCEDNSVSYLGITGDLFHKRGSVATTVYNAVYRVLQSFKEKGIKVIAIPGNHCQVSNEDIPENSLYGLKDIITVLGINRFVESIEIPNEKLTITGLPFSKNKNKSMEALIKEINLLKKSYPGYKHILMAHLGITGGFIGKRKYVMKDQYDAEDLDYDFFDYIALGHYHKPQIIKGTKNVFYTGSPLEHNFNDEGEIHGFWILNSSRKKSLEFVELNYPRFITVTKTSGLKQVTSSDFIRIQVTKEELDPIKTKLPDLDVNSVRLELKKDYEVESRLGVSIGMTFEEMIVKYGEELGKDNSLGLEIYAEAIGVKGGE